MTSTHHSLPNRLRQEFYLPNKAIGIPASRNIRSPARRKVRRQYDKRKAAGICVYFGCPAKPAAHRKYCRKHLADMVRRQQQIVQARRAKGLCVYCGKLPQFWGLRCLICRQKSGRRKSVRLLPLGARRALRLYRDAEKQLELDLLQAQTRFRIRILLASGVVTGNYARALWLYAGLDIGRWRTYAEVGSLMHLTKERVRMLLKPSKLILADSLGDNTPWQPLRRTDRILFTRR